MPDLKSESQFEEWVEATSESSEAEEKPAPHETVLLLALRRFVQMSGQPTPPDRAPAIGRWQKVVLLVVVLDLALLYLLFQESFNDPLVLLILKVLPWLLGATAFTYYSDAIQKRIVQLCRNKFVAFLALVIALPLLLSRQPIFSVLVKVDPDTVMIIPDDPADKLQIIQLDDKLFRIVTPDLLKAYRITVRDPSTENAPDSRDGFSRPFSPLLRRSQILRSTLAQIPVIGKLFGQQKLSLSPLYQQPMSADEDGDHLQIAGSFEHGYLEYLMQQPYAKRSCNRSFAHAGVDQILCSIASGDDALYLPPGRYNITVIKGTCTRDLGTKEIRMDKNQKIAFGTPCSH